MGGNEIKLTEIKHGYERFWGRWGGAAVETMAVSPNNLLPAAALAS